ncbi:hypothetical protein OIV83_000826 [Microbotryomycetes sp. JL201]|nr:hypothetical protein OIV83_000826 [Microbotryomycetes sp. JL201]
MSRSASPGPHEGQKHLIWGDTTSAKVVVVFLHGRGSTPEQDLPAFEATFEKADNGTGQVAAVFMRAQDEAWFSEHWNIPRKAQEPFISSAIAEVHKTIHGLPVPPSCVVLAGFSQGATVSLCYALEHPEVELGHIFALSGSIIGAPRDFGDSGRVISTRISICWGSQDRYYKPVKVEQDVNGLQDRGADVKVDLLPMGHWICQPELDTLSEMIARVLEQAKM